MFQLKVAPIDEARSLLLGGWPTHCVSLLDPGTPPPARAPAHLVLEVEDFGEESRSVAVVPTERHMRALLAFTNELREGDRLLVHCHGGIGRSPAAAIAVLAQHGASVDEALRRASAMRPWMMPNIVLLALADRALSLGGALASAGARFREDASRAAAGGGLILPTR